MWAAHNFLENFWGSSAVFWSLWALVSIHTCVYKHTYSTNTHTHHTNTHKTSHVHTTHLTYTQIHTQTHTCYTHTKSLKSQQKRQHVRYTSGLGFNSHWLRLLWVIGRRRESGGGVWLTKGQGWVKVGQELRVGYEVSGREEPGSVSGSEMEGEGRQSWEECSCPRGPAPAYLPQGSVEVLFILIHVWLFAFFLHLHFVSCPVGILLRHHGCLSTLYPILSHSLLLRLWWVLLARCKNVSFLLCLAISW